MSPDHSDRRVASPVNQARVAPQRHNEKSTLALPLLGAGAAPDVEMWEEYERRETTGGGTVGYVQKGNDIYTACIYCNHLDPPRH